MSVAGRMLTVLMYKIRVHALKIDCLLNLILIENYKISQILFIF